MNVKPADGGADDRFLSSAITPAQLAANRSNAQHSTGPKTEAGKAISSLNNFRHGLTGKFMILDWEDGAEFDELAQNLREEHQPATPTETLLVEDMAQHHWLKQRAIRLQQTTMDRQSPACEHQKELALYLRYQTTHERAFHKSLTQLLKLRAEKRKGRLDEAALSQRAEDSKNGFESQERKRNEETRRQANENRRQELHKWKALFAQAEVDHRVLLNRNLAGPGGELSVTIPRIIAAENAA